MKPNIQLGYKLTNKKIIIEGRNLNLRWFDRCILVWSDKSKTGNLPKHFLEIIEKALKIKEIQ